MKTEERSLMIKRLAIYLAAAFLPLIIGTPILNAVNGGPIFADMNLTDMNVLAYVTGVFGMLAPSIAVLITRAVTKEGMKDSFLALNFKGNARYYIAAVIFKHISNVISLLILWRMIYSDLTLSELLSELDIPTFTNLLLLQTAASIVLFFPAFGEEWGWRGYMMPKLTKLMGKPAAVIVGGVIWGLWHAPLTVSGHNFGLDYPGFPFVGIGLMCLFCTLMNAFLTLLTEKTNSVYPAAIAHSLNNNLTFGIFLPLLISEELRKRAADVPVIRSFMLNIIPMFLIAVISFILLTRKTEKTA